MEWSPARIVTVIVKLEHRSIADILCRNNGDMETMDNLLFYRGPNYRSKFTISVEVVFCFLVKEEDRVCFKVS